tara:strand:- start:314 stop:715 length:402 start_codon:yes stop_codon:yes gene_type:complete
MTLPEICVGAIAVVEGECLFIKRANEPNLDTWSIPGGRVENGESLTEAVEREFFEETGIVGDCGAFVGWSELISTNSHKVILDFEIETNGRPIPIPSSDAREAKWVPLKDLSHLKIADGLEAFLIRHGYVEGK